MDCKGLRRSGPSAPDGPDNRGHSGRKHGNGGTPIGRLIGEDPRDTALRALLKVPKEAIDATVARDKGRRQRTHDARIKSAPDTEVKRTFQFNPMEGSATAQHLGRCPARGFPLYVSVCVVLPTVSMIFAYYGFITNYGGLSVSSEGGFRAQYDHGIYRYRILGKVLLIAIDHLFTRLNIRGALHGNTPALEDPAFYFSYFVLYRSFLLLT